MGSSKKGMLNVLIAAVLWGSSGVCAQYIMQQSQMSSPFLTMTRLLFAGLILLMLSFFHGDKIFRVLQNRKDAVSLLIFSLFGALTVQYTFLMTIEQSNAATATVLQFLSPTIIVAWFAIARKTRPSPLVLAAIATSLAGTFLLVTHGNPTTLSISPRRCSGDCFGVCRRFLYDLSFDADCPLRHAADCRLEHAARRRDAAAVLRRTGQPFCGDRRPAAGLFLPGGNRHLADLQPLPERRAEDWRREGGDPQLRGAAE
jgi:hypothetical protein